jgi:cobalt transporter subunit CbtB
MERTATLLESRSDVMGAATFAIVLGFFLFFAAGLAHPEALHNAVHDTRHSLAFPCH